MSWTVKLSLNQEVKYNDKTDDDDDGGGGEE